MNSSNIFYYSSFSESPEYLSTLENAQKGEDSALTAVYEEYYSKIYQFCYYRVSHKETAEDITEDTFVKAFSGISKLQNLKAFEGWLYQIARNLVIDYYRQKRPQVALENIENIVEYENNIVDLINLEVEQGLLMKLLKELNEEQQSVIKLKFFEHLDNNIIAQMLNKTEGAIRVIQHRAIKQLQDLFEKLKKS